MQCLPMSLNPTSLPAFTNFYTRPISNDTKFFKQESILAVSTEWILYEFCKQKTDSTSKTEDNSTFQMSVAMGFSYQSN